MNNDTSAPAAPATHSCRCGVRRKNKYQSEAWIESPRTGTIITLGDGWWKENEMPPRLVARIVAAAAAGVHVLSFSTAELKAWAQIHAKYLKACAPPPGPRVESPRRTTGKWSRFGC